MHCLDVRNVPDHVQPASYGDLRVHNRGLALLGAVNFIDGDTLLKVPQPKSPRTHRFD